MERGGRRGPPESPRTPPQAKARKAKESSWGAAPGAGKGGPGGGAEGNLPAQPKPGGHGQAHARAVRDTSDLDPLEGEDCRFHGRSATGGGLTLYYKACKKYFPVLLCTTKLAQTTSQPYFVLHKVCTHYHFVLHSLQKVLPSTTLYDEACAKHFLVILLTTKLAHLRPSTTLYYKACTKKAFTHSKFFRREAFTHSKLFNQRSFYTQKLLHTTSFYTEKLLHTASVYTQNTCTQCFYTWQAFTHTANF